MEYLSGSKLGSVVVKILVELVELQLILIMSNITTFLTVAAIWLFLPLIILAWLPFYLARCGVKILAMLVSRGTI